MARRFATRSGIVRGGPRRATSWAASADATGEQALAAGAAILDQSLSQAQISTLVPATIVRTRGILWVASDQEGIDEQPFGAMGMVVVSEQARVAGVASIPTPISDEASDLWFVHQFWQADVAFVSASGFTTDGFKAYEFDSKAMRKVQEGDGIAVVLENASGVDGAVFILKFRMLFKLH